MFDWQDLPCLRWGESAIRSVVCQDLQSITVLPWVYRFWQVVGSVAGSAVVAAVLPKLISASEGAVGRSASRGLRHGPVSGREGNL